MNSKVNLISLVVVCLSIISCNNASHTKNLKPDMHTSTISVNWEGTYVGLTKAADCPGIYVMLAVDTASYETMNKYIDRQGIYIEKGKSKITNDSIKIGTASYRIGEDILFNSVDTLYKLNNNVNIPSAFTQKVLIENVKGGKTALLEEYIYNDKRTAKFSFLGNEYTLQLNDDNIQATEYTDGRNSLEMEIIDPAPEEVTTPIFSDGVNRYEFTIASPTNYIYTSADKSFFDVVYFNYDGKKSALLITNDIKKCYILPLSSTDSKRTKYSDKEISWIITHKEAELKNGKKTIIYTKNKITR